jgi:hypothetical protein
MMENSVLIAVIVVTIFFLWRSMSKANETETEEDEMGLYDDGSSDELLKTKLTCLMMAQSNTEEPRAADDIVADAQKFWDFIAKETDDD